jgi:hypothetical protein
MGRHTKLDNVENQEESPMEVDTTMVATVTPVGDKVEPAMEVDAEATMEESIVQKNAMSPQARASNEKASTAQDATKGTSLQQAMAAKNNDTEQDSKAAPTAAIPLCIEAEGPNYTNLWL